MKRGLNTDKSIRRFRRFSQIELAANSSAKICGLKICVSSVTEKRNPPAHADALAGGMKAGS